MKASAGTFRGNFLLLVFVIVIFNPSLAFAENNPSTKDDKVLSLGFFPIVSTVALFKRFTPLTDYLSASLNQTIHLKTAKDFPTFVKRTDERGYDIVITAPHFAVRAADSGKYKIRATTLNDAQQLIVTHKNNSINSIQQLAGKVISTPPEDALMTMIGMQFFRENGLTDDSAPVYRHFISHNAANEAVLAGESDAAIASSNVINKALKKGAPLKIIARGLSLPSMATMIATDLDEKLADRIIDSFLKMQDTEAGRLVLNQITFPGYRVVSAVDYEAARPYMKKIQYVSKIEN